MIEIEGFSPLQQEIADRMWAMDEVVDIDAYITMLPKRLRVEAQIVRDMMIAAYLDQVVEDVDLAKSVIDSVK